MWYCHLQKTNEELNDPYSSPNIVQVRWAGHVAHMGESRGLYWGFGGETRGKETTLETQV